MFGGSEAQRKENLEFQQAWEGDSIEHLLLNHTVHGSGVC
jgi:hypothetical protein